MNEIKDEDDDKLVFIDSNKEEFSFNTLRKLLNFISAIYNGEITLKEADISHRNLEEKIEELKQKYEPKNVKEKEEINGVLMHANNMLEYREENY